MSCANPVLLEVLPEFKSAQEVADGIVSKCLLTFDSLPFIPPEPYNVIRWVGVGSVLCVCMGRGEGEAGRGALRAVPARCRRSRSRARLRADASASARPSCLPHQDRLHHVCARARRQGPLVCAGETDCFLCLLQGVAVRARTCRPAAAAAAAACPALTPAAAAGRPSRRCIRACPTRGLRSLLRRRPSWLPLDTPWMRSSTRRRCAGALLPPCWRPAAACMPAALPEPGHGGALLVLHLLVLRPASRDPPPARLLPPSPDYRTAPRWRRQP